MNITFFMDKALEQANKALLANEVPIGAVLVDNNTNEIIASSHNLINSHYNSIFHAEILLQLSTFSVLYLPSLAFLFESLS